MPTVTVEFILPYEAEDYKIHQKAGAMHSLLCDFGNFLRQNTKYWSEESGLHEETVQKIRDHFWEEINDLNLGELF